MHVMRGASSLRTESSKRSGLMAGHKSVDKRILRTRRRLTEAFFDVLKEKGLDEMSVQDITDKAQINRATFYSHYEDKYDLFNTIIDHTFRQKLDSKIPAMAELDLGNLKVLILAVFEYLGQLNSVIPGVDEYPGPALETRIQHQIYALLRDWLENTKPGQMKWSMIPDITASYLSWAILGAGIMWSRDRQRYPAEYVADNTLLLIAGGLYGSLIE